MHAYNKYAYKLSIFFVNFLLNGFTYLIIIGIILQIINIVLNLFKGLCNNETV